MRPKKSKWLDANIQAIDKLTPQTWKFTIEFEDDFEFISGQFITIKLRGIQRSYSIASFSKNKKTLELIIVKVEGGQLTTILFSDVEPGEKIEVKGPVGHFVMPEDLDRDFLFICTGTGLAPFKSFLDEMQITQKFPKRTYLIFGTRTQEDLLFFNEMKALVDEIPNFSYTPVLSRENWDGAKGYVHEHYEKIVKNDNLKNPLFYICGWRNMILDARKNIKALGYDSGDIKLEIFD